MFSGKDISAMSFDKVMRGYREEDVRAFLEEVGAQFAKLEADNSDLEQKMFVLADKIEQYRNDEESLKITLINAQRVGESVLHEARAKAESILRDAQAKADSLVTEAATKAERVLSASDARLERDTLANTKLKAEISRFKTEVLELYKTHIDLLNELPSFEDEEIETFDEPVSDASTFVAEAFNGAADAQDETQGAVAEPANFFENLATEATQGALDGEVATETEFFAATVEVDDIAEVEDFTKSSVFTQDEEDDD